MSIPDSSDSLPTLFGPALQPFSKAPVAETPSDKLSDDAATIGPRGKADDSEPDVSFDATKAPRSEQHLDSAGTDSCNDERSDHASRYHRISEVGRGGCGVIDRAIDRALERQVAIKRLVNETPVSDQVRRQFVREAKITSQLQHPGIVPVHELGVTPNDGGTDNAYYVMKLLEGDTLLKQIQFRHQEARARCPYKPISRHQLTETIAPLLERFIDTCEAVAYAHEQGIIHRDLKPANIMVGEFGETIVLDWGLASKITSRAGTGSSKRWVSGTPAYMSPEQARGETDKLDQRSDIFSLGIILHEIVAGENPYVGMETPQVLEQVKNASPAPLRTLKRSAPPAIESIVSHATKMCPDDRYRSASELADDIRRFIAGAAVSVHRDSLPDRVMRWCRRNRTLATTVAVTMVALLVTSSIFGIVIHRAHRQELAARVEAEAAHRSSLASLIEARDATDGWLVGLSGSLEFYPGMAPLRQELLGKAIDQYKRLIDRPTRSAAGSVRESSSPEPFAERLERAKCHLRLGDLYRITNRPGASREHYDQSTKILSGLDQSVADVRIEQVNVWIGRLLINPSLGTRRVAAERHRKHLNEILPVDRPSRISDQTAKAASAVVRLELAVQHSNNLNASAQTKPAGAQAPQARDPRRLAHAAETARWLARARSESRHHHLSQTTQQELARLLEANGDIEGAIEVWTTLLGDHHQQSLADDDHPERLQSVAVASLGLAGLLAKHHRTSDAITLYREAITDLDRARQQLDAEPFFRTSLTKAKTDLQRLLTEVHLPNGEPSRAIKDDSNQ